MMSISTISRQMTNATGKPRRTPDLRPVRPLAQPQQASARLEGAVSAASRSRGCESFRPTTKAKPGPLRQQWIRWRASPQTQPDWYPRLLVDLIYSLPITQSTTLVARLQSDLPPSPP